MTDAPWLLEQLTNDPKLAMVAGDELVRRGPRMDFVLRRVPTRSGQEKIREVVVHPGAVLILPVLDDGRVVLIRNFRHTVHEALWELPAGTLEKGEDPALCAARELTEETGYTAAQVEALGWFFTSPGVLTEKMYVFLASGLVAGRQKLEDNERIEVHPLSFQTVRRMILENQIVDAKTVATLLKYELSRA
jgi:ADP-ribose pyrophosphatase